MYSLFVEQAIQKPRTWATRDASEKSRSVERCHGSWEGVAPQGDDAPLAATVAIVTYSR